MLNLDTLTPSLTRFIDEQLITEVLHPIKSGKEATVYCCRAHPHTGTEYYAAKVYRPIERRAFKNDAVYQEHRFEEDRRLQRAFAQKSRAGRAAQFGSWVGHEWRTMQRLHAAGAAVPQPVAHEHDTILMELVGDGATPAPLLRRVSLAPEEAAPLLDGVLATVELLLAHDVIHGDLSPFNILYHDGRLVLIDFPQSVQATRNSNAYDLLRRDIGNVCHYWQRYGATPDPDAVAGELWARFLIADL